MPRMDDGSAGDSDSYKMVATERGQLSIHPMNSYAPRQMAPQPVAAVGFQTSRMIQQQQQQQQQMQHGAADAKRDFPVFARTGVTSATRVQSSTPQEPRAFELAVPHVIMVRVPKGGTVGTLLSIMGENISSVFNDSRTVVHAATPGSSMELDHNYALADLPRFRATPDSITPVLTVHAHPSFNSEDYARQPVQQQQQVKGGAIAYDRNAGISQLHGGGQFGAEATDDDMEEYRVAHTIKTMVNFDGSKVYTVGGVTQAAIQHANELTNGFGRYNGKGNAHLAYGIRGTNKILEHIDYRHGSNEDAHFVDTIDMLAGGNNGSGANGLLFHLVPHSGQQNKSV